MWSCIFNKDYNSTMTDIVYFFSRNTVIRISVIFGCFVNVNKRFL